MLPVRFCSCRRRSVAAGATRRSPLCARNIISGTAWPTATAATDAGAMLRGRNTCTGGCFAIASHVARMHTQRRLWSRGGRGACDSTAIRAGVAAPVGGQGRGAQIKGACVRTAMQAPRLATESAVAVSRPGCAALLSGAQGNMFVIAAYARCSRGGEGTGQSAHAAGPAAPLPHRTLAPPPLPRCAVHRKVVIGRCNAVRPT